MQQAPLQQSENEDKSAKQIAKRSIIGRIFSVVGIAVLAIILTAFIINSLLVMYKDGYYTKWGKYRLFTITSNTMEPTIPGGSIISATVPVSADEITPDTSESEHNGTVIVFRAKVDGKTIVMTSRVVGVVTDADGNVTAYITRGDNADSDNAYRPTFDDIVGIYTGKNVVFLGAVFGFFHSPLGLGVLIFALIASIGIWVIVRIFKRMKERHALEVAALKKGSEALSGVQMRYDNINEITAVMDVIDMVTEQPATRAASKKVEERLSDFIKATSFGLPQNAETAALLDNLPAPDNPTSLAAALSAGATLRQAEDGQSLILTTMSGGKHIILTPIHTPDGIILCQQGARIRADIAPNIEEIGLTSIPTAPAFFEGQPLEKNVIYPELPQPGVKIGPASLLDHETSQHTAQQLLAAGINPTAVDGGGKPQPALEQGETSKEKALPPSSHVEPAQIDPAHISVPMRRNIDDGGEKSTPSRYDWRQSDASYQAYTKYRAKSTDEAMKQTAKLNSLLTDAQPLSQKDKERVEQYRAANKTKKPAKKRAPRTPEQKAKAKAAAERRKIAEQAFLTALSPEDRELYLAERKLAKSRAQAIRELKRLVADRKLLESINKSDDGEGEGEPK